MDAVVVIGLVLFALGVGIYGSIIGAGGGFLMVAGLVIVFDLAGPTAVGTSVVATLLIQLTGAYTYDRKGLVDRATAAWFVIGSVPVAFASGAWLANRIPQRAFDLSFGLLLLALAAFVVIVRSPTPPEDGVLEPRRRPLVSVGAVIGLLSGGAGAGAGLVTVPFLRSLQRLSAHRAAATTTLTGAIAGAAATVGHTIAGNPEWNHVPALGVGAVVGARIGALASGHLSQRTVLVLLAGGLVIAGVPLVLRAL